MSVLGADDTQTELYTGSDLRSCRFESNEEDRRFLGGVFRRTCLPEAEVSAIRSLLLARALKRRGGNNETELRDRLEARRKELHKEQAEVGCPAEGGE
jgi:hypothetical protein